MFTYILTRLLNSKPPTPLHRWCLPTSPVYAVTCDQMRKGALADVDNGHYMLHPPHRPSGSVFQYERDTVTVFADSFGM